MRLLKGKLSDHLLITYSSFLLLWSMERTYELGKVLCDQKIWGIFPVVQWLRLQTSTERALDLIPGWGTKIPYANRFGQKRKSKVRFERNARAWRWQEPGLRLVTRQRGLLQRAFSCQKLLTPCGRRCYRWGRGPGQAVDLGWRHNWEVLDLKLNLSLGKSWVLRLVSLWRF